jgi:hypothetical protein
MFIVSLLPPLTHALPVDRWLVALGLLVVILVECGSWFRVTPNGPPGVGGASHRYLVRPESMTWAVAVALRVAGPYFR